MATPVLMPQMGESITEGTIVRWIKKVGDVVDRDEPLFEISTDKVDAEIPAPCAGVLLEIRVAEGETVPVDTVVASIGAAGERVSSSRQSEDTPVRPTVSAAPVPSAPPVEASTSLPEPVPAVPPPPPGGSGPRRTSPLVRQMAKTHEIDLAKVPGTGLGGRVTKRDVEAYLDARLVSSTPTPPGDGTERRPLTPIRKKIAEHMVMSRRTSAHVHTVFHVDFSTVMALRQQKRAEYEREGVRLTYLAFIAKAVADALRRHPMVNASLDGDTVVLRKGVNLGVAVALDTGLIVPVVRQADEKSVRALAREIADLADRARTKKLSPDDVHGGTFTITNPGQFGAQFGLPIINQPQVAILGIGAIEKRPVVVDDAVVVRPMAYFALGFDHRLIDGAVADQFMADVKNGIEHFDAGQL